MISSLVYNVVFTFLHLFYKKFEYRLIRGSFISSQYLILLLTYLLYFSTH